PTMRRPIPKSNAILMPLEVKARFSSSDRTFIGTFQLFLISFVSAYLAFFSKSQYLPNMTIHERVTSCPRTIILYVPERLLRPVQQRFRFGRLVRRLEHDKSSR